jgi:hypothetical protein
MGYRCNANHPGREEQREKRQRDWGWHIAQQLPGTSWSALCEQNYRAHMHNEDAGEEREHWPLREHRRVGQHSRQRDQKLSGETYDADPQRKACAGPQDSVSGMEEPLDHVGIIGHAMATPEGAEARIVAAIIGGALNSTPTVVEAATTTSTIMVGGPGMIPSVLRIAATCLILSATAVLVAGCGGSAHASSSTVSSRTTASAPITKGQAVVFAHAVNLRAADLRGWSLGSAPEAQPVTHTSDPAFARCVGVRPSRYVTSAQSPGFIRDRFREVASSKVIVLPTALLAAGELATLTTARGHSCFARLTRPETTSGSQLSFDRISWLPVGLPPEAHGFKVRIAGEITFTNAASSRIRIYIDLLGFVTGPAEIFLVDSRWGSPVRSSTERRLLLLLYSRARAHNL